MIAPRFEELHADGRWTSEGALLGGQHAKCSITEQGARKKYKMQTTQTGEASESGVLRSSGGRPEEIRPVLLICCDATYWDLHPHPSR
jgi:hypothetical protein